MSNAVSNAYDKLNVLTMAEYRGRGDTLGAALDRTARKIGLAPSYAKRIWNRWREMTDVSGNALDAIYAAHSAYERACVAIEARGDHYRQIREDQWHGRQNGEGHRADGLGRTDGVARHPAKTEGRADVGS